MANSPAVLLDLSGVLYQGQEALPGAPQALERLRQLGLPLRFITNTTRQTSRDLRQHLADMGLEIDDDELFTAARAARWQLESRQLTAYRLIHPALEPEFADLPHAEPNAVLVADAGEAFTYPAMNQAFHLLVNGAVLIAISRNRYFRDRDDLSMDAGPFVAALEFAAGTTAEVIGKPQPGLFRTALASIGATPAEAVMIGDDADGDINGALRAGLGEALLVRTGKYREGDEARLQAGGDTVADLAAAVERIASRA